MPASLLSDTPLASRTPLPTRWPTAARLAQLLDDLAPTTLSELDAVPLLNRVDTKFLLSESQLASLLTELTDEYRVLEIAGRRFHQYRTLYFDTPGFDLYRRHHAGEAVRYKVRTRLYVDSGLAFFEIKAKDAEGRTIKHRLATERMLTDLSRGAQALLARHASPADREVEPKLRNDFLRVTLSGIRSAERVTFDLAVQFDCEGRTAILPGAVIAEVKQSSRDGDSPFLRRMQEAGRQATSVSKYCVGVALLVSGVEHDAFDEKLRAFEQLGHDLPWPHAR